MPILGFIDGGGDTPGRPVMGTATAGNTRAVITFVPPSYIGKGTISYTAVSTPGGFTGSSAGSPIEVAGLTNGTAYTFIVFGTTNYGIQSASTAPSNAVTPFAPPVYPPYGTLLAANQCSGTTLFNLRADGSGGTYNEILAYNSTACGYQPPPPACTAYGTFLSSSCSGTTLIYNYANGTCGSYSVSQGQVAGQCGYVPLPNCGCCTAITVTGTQCFCPRGPEYTCIPQARSGTYYGGGCAVSGAGTNCSGTCNPATCDCSSVAGVTSWGAWYNTGGPRCYP
jgi:hypothetical protein